MRPGDGQPEEAAFAAQMILRTDLAPTVWRGSDGLTVQMRGYSDAKPRAGVKLDLLARDNDILASATTDADGVARFAAPLLAGDGPLAPAAIHGMLDGDLVALDLNAAAFDLSDRGVSGMPDPGPLDAFVYTDRGIYRPGETVQVMALLRDAAGRPADIPARIRVKRPNGEIFTESVPPRTGDAAENLPVTLSFGAAIGTWSIEVLADPDRPPIGRGELPRRQFRAGPHGGGARARPGADRRRQGLRAARHRPLPLRRAGGEPHRQGDAASGNRPRSARRARRATASGSTARNTRPRTATSACPRPMRQGKTGAAHPHRPRARHHASRARRISMSAWTTPPATRRTRISSIPLRPAGRLIGIKPGFDGSVDANTEAGFDIAAVDPDGRRVAVPAKLRLVRERPDWRLVMKGSSRASRSSGATSRSRRATSPSRPMARCITARRSASAATGWKWRRAAAGWRRPPCGSARAGSPPTAPTCRTRWMSRRTGRATRPDATARVHIAPPFAGEATVAVLTDRVHSLRTLAVPAGGTDIDVPVDPAWGPGAYVAVHVFRGGGTQDRADATRPARAIGLTWLGIDPASRTLAVAIGAPDEVRPRIRSTIPVRTAPGAWVTVAAVDEGILRLTDFVAPDPAAHFLGRRALGLDIRDDWGRLILPAEGNATALRQGGDEGAGGIREIPQKIVSLFQAPVQAGADGVANIPFDFPDFNGQVRLMVVAWQGNNIGGASKDMLVRDQLVAEPLLPRFLAPGDSARFAVLMQNLELPAGEAAVALSVDGPLALDGPDRLAASLAPNAQSVQFTGLKGTGAGRGVIHLDVTGPSGFHIQRETAIVVRPARGRTADIASADLAPATEARITPPIDRFIAGTWRAEASFGGAVRYDAAAIAQALDDYPLFCLEQSASKGFALAMEQGPLAGPDRDARLQTAIAAVLDKQRYDGGFALWSANGDAEVWLSSYATEFLLRAKAAGATVPEAALKDALKYEQDGLDTALDSPDHLAEQAYRIYVLALAGRPPAGAARVLTERLNRLPTPLARAQLGAALARANDRPRAEAAFNAALAAPGAQALGHGLRHGDARPGGDRGAAQGERAAARPHPDADRPDAGQRPQARHAEHPGGCLADRRRRRARPRRAAGERHLQRHAARAGAGDLRRAHRAGDGAQHRAEGDLPDRLDHGRAHRRARRLARADAGEPAVLQSRRLGRSISTSSGRTRCSCCCSQGQSDDGQDHRAMLLQGLPAGWEIAGRFDAGEVPGMSWLGDAVGHRGAARRR